MQQKVLGLLGGMSWESTIPYYRIINEYVKATLGGLHSAKLLLHSVDFHEIEQLQSSGRWDIAARQLADAAIGLKQAGAEAIVICTNTMHKVADSVEQECGLPLVHIADATATAIRQRHFSRVALLGTRYTMEQDFYRQRIGDRFGLEVLIPEQADRETVNHIIFDELCVGKIEPLSRHFLQRLVQRLAERGAEGVILGCTELPLLLAQNNATLPLFDTTHIHAVAAARYALGMSSETQK